MRSPCFERLIVLCVAAVTAWGPLANTSRAARVAVDQDAGTAVCEYSEASEQPLIEYRVAFGEMAVAQAVPRLRVYGDGRVRVHRPAFMKKPGDYELWLSRQELSDLLASIAAKGVLDFDENRVKTARKMRVEETRARQVREGRSMTFTYTADADVTTLAVFLDQYLPADPNLPARRNLVKRISWRNLAGDAREHPQIQEIVHLAAAAEEVSRLEKRRDLKRIDE